MRLFPTLSIGSTSKFIVVKKLVQCLMILIVVVYGSLRAIIGKYAFIRIDKDLGVKLVLRR